MSEGNQEPAYQYVKVCADTAGQDCIWTTYHSTLPPLSVGDSLEILGASALVLAVAWSVGVTYRVLFYKTR
ncbi:hypothetical protein CK501_15940 [Halovibrio salipaludis]|uniref:Uncharacterized protein n=1 Tax=Halovibrio salipaludis TaxID=2032626 RepID=A0A2A2ETI0_9GAMM|nr:hypothetical protein CK501_15940 [Halovibrio salipaludis]